MTFPGDPVPLSCGRRSWRTQGPGGRRRTPQPRRRVVRPHHRNRQLQKSRLYLTVIDLAWRVSARSKRSGAAGHAASPLFGFSRASGRLSRKVLRKRHPWAREVSRQQPELIETIEKVAIDGFDGMLRPNLRRRSWQIIYGEQRDYPGRERFSLAHEFGHYMLHRHDLPERVGAADSAYRCLPVQMDR